MRAFASKTLPPSTLAGLLTRVQLAEEAHVSVKTIERAATVKKADPKLFKAVEEGKISVKKAAAEVKAGYAGARRGAVADQSPPPGAFLRQGARRRPPPPPAPLRYVTPCTTTATELLA